MVVMRQSVRAVRRWTRGATAGHRVLPDFLIIGVQKAGTSSLYHYLVQHADIRTAATKEVHFFDHQHSRGAGWYRAQFPLAATERTWLSGEATPYYLLHPRVPERVAQLVPDVRLIVLLRDPVSRAYSHFQHSRALGFEPLTDFEAAIDSESGRTDQAWARLERGAEREPAIEQFTYLRRSRYAPQLRRWLSAFPRESLLMLTAEELYRDPGGTVNTVRRHLALPPSSQPIEWDARNARGYAPLADRLRQRLRDEFAPDVAEVEQLLGQPTGWRS